MLRLTGYGVAALETEACLSAFKSIRAGIVAPG